MNTPAPFELPDPLAGFFASGISTQQLNDLADHAAMFIRNGYGSPELKMVAAAINRARGAGPCGMTHDEHMRDWKTFADDCDACGFAVQDVDQCERGHPDDGCTECGACGHGMPWGAR